MRRAGRAVGGALALLFVAGFASAGAAPRGRVELTFADPEIVESSGLVAVGPYVVTVNDSGDTGRVFTVDRATGETVGVTTWSEDPEDVEAIAPAGPGEVWVADIGDNAEARETVEVARVPVGPGDRDVDVATYELVYPDGPRDAETLLVDPATGRLVVVTKAIFGGDVLLAPARLDPDRANRLRPIGSARGIATDGAFWPDGRHLVVRGYTSAVVYTWPDLDIVDRLDLPEQMQGEGIAVDADGVVLVSSEGARSDVLRVRLPRRVARAVAPVPPPDPVGTGSATPTVPGEETPPPDSSAADPDEVVVGSVRPYVIGGVVGLVMLALLVRSLRPRG